MRSPALISIRSRTGCHAVLASLSGRYPPLEGRSPTRYSPVRHSVSIATDRVRLACVRHAASVDSEPGSNSHVKFAVRPIDSADAFTSGLAQGFATCLTRAPVENGSCVVSYCYVRLRACRTRVRQPTPADKLTLDGLLSNPLAETLEQKPGDCSPSCR